MLEILIPVAFGAVFASLWASTARTTPNNTYIQKDDGIGVLDPLMGKTLREAVRDAASSVESPDEDVSITVPVNYRMHGHTSNDGRTLNPRAKIFLDTVFGAGFRFDPQEVPFPGGRIYDSRENRELWRQRRNRVKVTATRAVWAAWLAWDEWVDRQGQR